MGMVGMEENRRLIRNILRKDGMWQVVDDLWERIGAKAKAKGMCVKDITRIIREIRSSR